MTNRSLFRPTFILLFTCTFVVLRLALFAQEDPLSSWNDGATKKAIIQFVKEVTDKGSPNYVAPEDRIATFDQDGTLWGEQPLYTQFIFAFDRIKLLVSEHPEWKKEEPFSTVLSGGQKAITQLSTEDIRKIVNTANSGITVEAYHDLVRQWLKTALHPRYEKPFTSLEYQPMLEVMQFFKDNGFTNYIVSGAGQEFIRSYAKEEYNLPPERIIGTAGVVSYEYQNGKPVLMQMPKILFLDNYQGKPESINLIIGRRPIAAFGNSDGDRQMLEWTQAGTGLRLELLVHHDDAEREYAYDEHSKVGTFSASLMAEAKERKWLVVSMKNDWKVIFAWQQKCVENQKAEKSEAGSRK